MSTFTDIGDIDTSFTENYDVVIITYDDANYTYDDIRVTYDGAVETNWNSENDVTTIFTDYNDI